MDGRGDGFVARPIGTAWENLTENFRLFCGDSDQSEREPRLFWPWAVTMNAASGLFHSFPVNAAGSRRLHRDGEANLANHVV